MSKTLTKQQINDLAKQYDIDPTSLKAVIEVECRGKGFLSTGEPVILFERHVFYRRLGKIRWFSKRKQSARTNPSLCNRRWGGYNSHKCDQHKRLQLAEQLDGVGSPELRAVALESCSWGLGQVMGYHWQALGYKDLQEFINAMYHSEAKQLEAMIRFIKANKLTDKLNNQQWSAFAKRYNGKYYRKNRYARKLAKAYQKHLHA